MRVPWHGGEVERFESPVERQIREAMERGDFDDLPGAGKPLPDLGDTSDPDWWLKGLIEREQLDMTGALPPSIALRKEAATFPASLVDLRGEDSVRAVLEDYNRRVRRSRLELVRGPHPPILAPTVDVDALVEQWRVLRAERDTAQRAAAERAAAEVAREEERRAAGRRRVGRRWWRRQGRTTSR